MIRSETEYKDAVARSRKSAQRLAEYRDELRCQGRSVDEIERTVGLAVHLLEDLNEQIGHYERIKRGDLSGFKTLRDVGQLLIAARVAQISVSANSPRDWVSTSRRSLATKRMSIKGFRSSGPRRSSRFSRSVSISA